MNDLCESCAQPRPLITISFSDDSETFHVCVACAADAIRNGCTEQTCTHVEAVHQYDLP